MIARHVRQIESGSARRSNSYHAVYEKKPVKDSCESNFDGSEFELLVPVEHLLYHDEKKKKKKLIRTKRNIQNYNVLYMKSMNFQTVLREFSNLTDNCKVSKLNSYI